jgi:hypothetical protein
MAQFFAHYRVALCLGVLLVGFLSPAVAAPILIDDFAAPNPQDVFIISLFNSDPFTNAYLDPGILGGQRNLLVDVDGTPKALTAVGTIGEGALDVNTSTPGAYIELGYLGVGGGGLGGVDLVDGTNTGIRLDFDFIDPAGAEFGILLGNGLGTATFVDFLPTSVGPTSIFVPFSSFLIAGGFTFTSVDSLFVGFNVAPIPAPGLDFTLTSIQATVPEPSTLALATFAGLALAAYGLRQKLAR